MNIALIGYGKMGKAIEQQANIRGHKIVAIVDQHNREEIKELKGKDVDVAIEFTSPESATENILNLLEIGIPVVCGSTGWYSHFPKVENLINEKNGTLIHATNFSLGVNIFFNLNKHLARLMGKYPEYKVSMEEIHHTQKLDAPSGTAITLAEGILENNSLVTNWENTLDENIFSEFKSTPSSLPILSKRIDPAPGTHSVTYASEIDKIEITHEAFSRTGFALGAVMAAEMSAGKKGVIAFRDLLELG
jgi:4-hydroxy-tetrahydrodipicolinate reductase